jgi:hypothetical protein
MKKLVILLCLLPCTGRSQFADDFSDGNFTTNPAWFGDTMQFKICNSSAIPPAQKPALQLNGVGADTSSLYLPNSLLINAEWRFWVKLSFNTSANNYARVYLASNQSGLEYDLNGYYVQVGGASDSLCLFRQAGNTSTRIIQGVHAYTGNSMNVLRIRITHDHTGYWKMYSDPSGNSNFEHEGSCLDTTFKQTSFFGIFCKYTSSNATKFYFDDFSVVPFQPDTIPPTLSSIQASGENCLDVLFNEPVDKLSSGKPENYWVDQGIGAPETAERDAWNPALVHLMFATVFVEGGDYQLTAANISDVEGNLMGPVMALFTYFPPAPVKPYQVQVDEIMTDINPPPQGLPEAEYIELLNLSGHSLNLAGWTLTIKSSQEPLAFPPVIMQPDSFLLVTSPASSSLFQSFGQVAGMQGFSLNNEDVLSLKDPNGTLIQVLSFTDDWYHDPDKDDGGWSMELIDPSCPCQGGVNWQASTDGSGGTPDKINSAAGARYSLPGIISTSALDDSTVLIRFNHTMEPNTTLSKQAYYIDNLVGHPSSILFWDEEDQSVLLTFQNKLQAGLDYCLTLSDTLKNCAGIVINPGSQYAFGLPEPAGPFDVVINEIMADPEPPNGLPEYEYLELFNRTSKLISLGGWTLSLGSNDKVFPDVLIGPGEYLLLGNDDVASLFSCFGKFVGFTSFSITNEGQGIILRDHHQQLISAINFTDNWYGDSDKSGGGWSLEQIDPGNPCGGEENWKASDHPSGGTPGSLNSVDGTSGQQPSIRFIACLSDSSFKVIFSNRMDEQALQHASAYSVDRGVGHPLSATLPGDDQNAVVLSFPSGLLKRVVYTLTINESLPNCTGIPMPPGTGAQFGIPEMPLAGDILINEVLFNPAGDGCDFVEIYCPGDKIINMKEVYLGSIKEPDFQLPDTTLYQICSNDLLVFPGEYRIFTSCPEVVAEHYPTSCMGSFTYMRSFPSYNNDRGIVVIKSSEALIIDALHYDEDMHFPLLNSTEGVSLERISFTCPTEDRDNWHSAAEAAGFATPGCENSQHAEGKPLDDPVSLDPEIFSPDNDGHDDVLMVNYHFNRSGFAATVTVFDPGGRPVRWLARNELLGTRGAFIWDGLNEDAYKAETGMYIIFIEVFNLDGQVKTYKKICVLAGKF